MTQTARPPLRIPEEKWDLLHEEVDKKLKKCLQTVFFNHLVQELDKAERIFISKCRYPTKD